MYPSHAFREQRPPYVEFETRAEEDRRASIEAGRYVAKDVDYAIIRAIGAKDAVEKPALEWLKHIEDQAQRGAYNPEWVKFFKQLYAEWKQGHELSVNGTHVKHWPSISPAQRDMLIAAKLLTVEDVANATEEALQRVGLGARDLKHRAQAWLDMANKHGSAEELAMLREQTANQAEQIAALQDELRQLRHALSARQFEEEDEAPQKEARKRRA